MSDIITLDGKVLINSGKAIAVDMQEATGDKLLWREETADVANKATATYIWPFPVRAYINITNDYWSFYNDSSTSFCFSVEYNQTYHVTWDSTYNSNIYRIAFVKDDDVPSYTNSNTARKTTYDATGTQGFELNGFQQDYSFTVTDSSIKMCVIQISGTNELWTNGTIRSWFIELMSHLTITKEGRVK